MGGPRLDPSVWNLGLPMLAIAACGPIVALGETDGTTSADSNDMDGKDDDDGPDGPGSNTSPSTTMPGTVTVSTTVPTECNYDSDCPPGYRCQYGQCYYDGYCQDGTCCSPECGWYQECYSHYSCPEAQECRYYDCQPLQTETVCESIPFGIEFEIPVVEGNPISLAFIESDGVPGRELLVGGQGITLHRIDGTSAVIDTDSFAYDMRVRDIDLDGDEDIAFVDYNTLTAKVVLNDGMWTTISLDGGSPEALALLDVQGDGRVDVVGASSSDGVLVWVQESPTQWNGPDYMFEPAWDISGGDLDGDGLEDAAVHGYTTSVLFAGLGASMHLPHGIDGNFRRALVGNFGGEPLPGVVTVEGVNQGAIATYWVPPVLQAAGWYTTWWPWRMDYARIGDVNVDGYTDIVGGGTNLAIAWGGPEADGIVCISDVPAPLAPYALAVGDMSGDGRPDIAITDSVSVRVLLRTD